MFPSFHRRLPAAALSLTLLLALALPAAAFRFGSPRGGEAGDACVLSFAKNGQPGEVITFSPEDFRVDTGGRAALDAVVLSSLPDPAAGQLTLAGQPLRVGDSIAEGALSGLQFHSALQPTVPGSSFRFTPVFAGGRSGESATVSLYLLSAENHAPVAQNQQLTTYRNTALTARFTATDPEGDLLTFQLVDKPARGTVTLPDQGEDTFVYTPYEKKTGKDSFTYVAVDAVGNVSAPATVKLRIVKPDTDVMYADLKGVPAANAAIRLAEEGLFVGECMGGQYFFQPDLPVSRGQFVALLMDVAGVERLEDVTSTGFADDTSIPLWAKPYVAAALKHGLVRGCQDAAGQMAFAADRPITRAEASVLLNRVLQITDVAQPTFGVDLSRAPAWAVQSAANLESCGLLKPDGCGVLGLSSPLDRAETAQLMADALEVLEARRPKFSLFG